MTAGSARSVALSRRRHALRHVDQGRSSRREAETLQVRGGEHDSIELAVVARI
jgi:hypothetical protein